MTIILVRKPSTSHIPYFAMREESTQPNHRRLNLPAALDSKGSAKPGHGKLFGPKTVSWIRDRLNNGTTIDLYGTWNYIPKQTSVHMEWLKFADDAVANEFITTWPHYDIPTRIEKLTKVRDELAERLQRRIDRGGFDLSKISADQRATVAYRYYEADTKIRDLDQQITLLRMAITLRAEWIGKL
jgi:hypothetical protein